MVLLIAIVSATVGCMRQPNLKPFNDGTAYDDAAAPQNGLAAAYPYDRGIRNDPDVIFADDFEQWNADGTQPPKNGWSVRTQPTSSTRVVPGTVLVNDVSGPGRHVLEIACWTEGGRGQVGGLSLKLGNYVNKFEGLGDGYDEIYIRYYIKFDKDYLLERNHGSNLGGRDLEREDARWVGMAGIRDPSQLGYFYSGVQPYGQKGAPFFWLGYYSYHMDKQIAWGENYGEVKRIYLDVGTWHCVERHMRLNSIDPTKSDPALADGLEELWIDGILTNRKEGVRFRRVAHLHITYFSLETYYHHLPLAYGRSNPIKVYYDNVVIARRYIGRIRTN